MIAKCPKPQKDNEKRRKQVRFNEKVNRACNNGENNSDQKIYASMARMSSNDERSSENYGDILQLINWILDSGETYHITPEVSDFIPRSLEDTDKYIDDNGKPFIATLHNVILATDLCDRLFSIITLMNSEHTCLFNKGFCTVYFGAK